MCSRFRRVWEQSSTWDTRRPSEQLPMSNLPLELFINRFDKNVLSGLRSVLFNGRFGDPLVHPEIVDFVRHLRFLKPDLLISIYTNGSLRDSEVWRELGNLIGGRGQIYFAIDGLEDTNSMYRQKTSWGKIMSSAKAFIEGGGRAIWSYLIFDHNSHQVAEAKELAEKLGFQGFEARKTSRFKGQDSFKYIDVSGFEKELRPPGENSDRYEYHDQYLNNQPAKLNIDCDFRSHKKLFVSAFGRLWPCSYVSDYFPVNVTGKQIEQRYGSEFNVLERYSVGEILNSRFFKELPSSWSYGDRVLKECWKKCNRKHHNITSVDVTDLG
ncbi:MAG: radical SAM protein [Bdellovibrionales bacterium]|nr:radical SAM protein [Bdellovibrionales bacterium]